MEDAYSSTIIYVCLGFGNKQCFLCTFGHVQLRYTAMVYLAM